MGKRYYCDYCDRSFKDVQNARKKHLISLQHSKNKDEHYSHFKDPQIILTEEKNKNPCLRFITNGECQFGSSCRYSHYTPEMMQQLENIVAIKSGMKYKAYNPDPEYIIKEYFEDLVDPEEIIENDINIWSLPPQLKNYPNLPPSLLPLTYKDFTSSDFPEWGWR